MRTRLLAALPLIAVTIVTVVSGRTCMTRTFAAAQSGNDLFQQALSKERAEGKLDEAIQIYERIAKEFSSDRALAARALLQLGRCYERLGRSEAQTAYERLVREYADQRAAADEARARLAELARARAPNVTVASHLVWSGDDVDTGRVV